LSKIRVYQVAKELNISSKDIITKLEELKIEVHNHMSSLEDNEVALVKKIFGKKEEVKANVKTEAKTEDKPKKKKSWTVGTPKVNRPKRRSDFNKSNRYNKPAPKQEENKEAPVATKPVVKQEQPAAKPVTENKPVQKPQASQNNNRSNDNRNNNRSNDNRNNNRSNDNRNNTRSNDNKNNTRSNDNRNNTRSNDNRNNTRSNDNRNNTRSNDNRNNTRSNDNRNNNRPNDNRNNNRPNNNRPSVPVAAAPAPSEAAKSNAKKNKKKKEKKVYNKNASLEDKFSKRVKGKKKKKETKTIDTSQYYDADGHLLVPERVTVGKFSEMLGKTSADVIMKLMATGIMANLNQEIEYETAELIAMEFDIETKVLVPVDEAEVLVEKYFEEDKSTEKVSRPPVVTVMGHVDHGKTSLLDAIRETAVTDKEAGGITQHIGASEAMINGQKIVFLDTPGHEAFTTLRARGAQVTDIAVLVVAADDGVMPQTIEAIDHAKAAGVPIIVAINKIDKPGNNPDQVKTELSEHGILVEDWGGDVISVEVSALKKINIDGLLEMILLQSEVLELQAAEDKSATGTIIDAKVDKGRGIVATLLVQDGTLEVGNPIVCGAAYGKVRAMYNHVGKRVKSATPSTGVEITGLNEIPVAGDRFFVAEDERTARKIAEKKSISERNEALKDTPQHVTLEDIFDRIQAGKTKEIKIVLKADVQGSLEALKTSLLKLTTEEVTVNVIHSSVGTVTESDVLLASASDAIIIGFNVRPSMVVENLAGREGVELKTYRIIYEAINDVSDALIGMLDPEFKEEVLGTIEVRQLIRVPNVGTIAGGYVMSGKITRSAEFRLIREGIIVHEGKIASLKRFKDDVKEVAKGYECGIGFESFNEMKEGDVIEAFHMVEIKRKK